VLGLYVNEGKYTIRRPGFRGYKRDAGRADLKVTGETPVIPVRGTLEELDLKVTGEMPVIPVRGTFEELDLKVTGEIPVIPVGRTPVIPVNH
jgi:hypothetical protein